MGQKQFPTIAVHLNELISSNHHHKYGRADCFEVDISATPFTKLLAIQRMGLKPGESSGLSVAYIAVPEMELKAAGQRYTYLERHSQCGVYMYEALFRGFTAKLPVDADGIVIDYPQTFRRVWN